MVGCSKKTQAAELRSLEELSAAGVKQVSRPTVSFRYKMRQPINKVADPLLEEATVARVHAHIHRWSMCLCIYSKTWKPSVLSPVDRRSETAACTCTHTGTHTNTQALTAAALLWHVQLWQLVFLRPLALCDDSETGR